MNQHQPKPLRLGTRGSLLARMQSEGVARLVRGVVGSGGDVEIVIISTTGDRVQDKPLHDVGGKGLFTRELEQALLRGEIDFAVHSYKDVPVTMPLVDVSGLAIAAVPEREDARDVLVAGDVAICINDLPNSARVGTGSLRRRCQLLTIRPDLRVLPLRGNIDTRLRKLTEEGLDAIILAAAGLKRAGLFNPATMSPIDAMEMVPAPGQGALALQCRSDDRNTISVLGQLNDPGTATCVDIERELVRLLQADCHSPVGIHATLVGAKMRVAASVGRYDGAGPTISAVIEGASSDCKLLADKMFGVLRDRGAPEALHAR